MGCIPDGHSVEKHSGARGRGKRFAQHQEIVCLNESYLNAISCECADQGSGSTGRPFNSQARGTGIEITHYRKFCSELVEVPPRNQTRCLVLWCRPAGHQHLLLSYRPT
eukprot:5577018-Pleurochrysis_carterae.AAC.1